MNNIPLTFVYFISIFSLICGNANEDEILGFIDVRAFGKPDQNVGMALKRIDDFKSLTSLAINYLRRNFEEVETRNRKS